MPLLKRPQATGSSSITHFASPKGACPRTCWQRRQLSLSHKCLCPRPEWCGGSFTSAAVMKTFYFFISLKKNPKIKRGISQVHVVCTILAPCPSLIPGLGRSHPSQLLQTQQDPPPITSLFLGGPGACAPC